MFGVEVKEEKRRVNTDVHVSGIGDVLDDPLEDGLDRSFVPAL